MRIQRSWTFTLHFLDENELSRERKWTIERSHFEYMSGQSGTRLKPIWL
jgi:hypothetical protein